MIDGWRRDSGLPDWLGTGFIASFVGGLEEMASKEITARLVTKNMKIISLYRKWYCKECLLGPNKGRTFPPYLWHTDLCDSCFRNLGVTAIWFERPKKEKKKWKKHSRARKS